VTEPIPSEEVELFRRIADGDTAALGQLYDGEGGKLFALAFRILNDHKEAEDVVQEVFLQVWEKAATLDPRQGRPLAWLTTSTRNKAIDRLRSAQRRARLVQEAGAELALDCADPQAPAQTVLLQGDEVELVRGALARLQGEQRQAIEMAFFGGLTQTEIAAALHEPLGTVKARIRRGMLKLREELAPRLRNESPVGNVQSDGMTT
jgi:RNA polymerase sigma-70 factor (ECF subfamily)